MNSKLMHALRKEIDEIDTEVLQLLGRRMKCADAIGRYKKEQHLPVVQGQRWQEILKRRIAQGKEEGLASDFINAILHTVHDESVRIQNQIVKGSS